MLVNCTFLYFPELQLPMHYPLWIIIPAHEWWIICYIESLNLKQFSAELNQVTKSKFEIIISHNLQNGPTGWIHNIFIICYTFT